MRINVVKYIREGEMLPPGYGMAWSDTGSDTMACYPFPLNIALGWIRKYWRKRRFYHVRNSLLDKQFERVRGLTLEVGRLRDELAEFREKSARGGVMVTPEEYHAERIKSRNQGARDMYNAFADDAGIERMPDDRDPYN